MDTRRIFGNEKVFLTPEERQQARTGAIDQFMTDMSGIPRLLQQFVAKPTPLTPGEWYNPVQGSKEALAAEDRAWYAHQASQPQPYQQARSLGTFAAVAADPLNYINPSSAPVKGMARLANFALKEAATPAGRQVMKNALTNQRGMFVPPTMEEINALGRMAKGEEVKDVPWVWSELTDRMPRTEISDDAAKMLRPYGDSYGRADMFMDSESVQREGLGGISTIADANYGRNAGNFNPTTNTITLGETGTSAERKGIMLHELQHAIQERGNWARGGSPEGMADNFTANRARLAYLEQDEDMRAILDLVNGEEDRLIMSDLPEPEISKGLAALDQKFRKLYPEYQEYKEVLSRIQGRTADGMDSYKRLAGEEEARRTAARANMTMSERYGNPYKGTDIPDPRDLIVTRGGGTAMSVGDSREEKLQRIIDKLKEKYTDVGIRTADGPPVGDYKYSKIWDDGTPTGDELEGISTTSVDTHQAFLPHLDKKDIGSGYYPGKYTYLIGSNRNYGWGEDVGEIILDPEYIRRIKVHK